VKAKISKLELKISPNTPNIESAPKHVKKSHAHKLIFGCLALLIITTLVGSIYHWQHNKVDYLDTEVSALQTQVTKANAANAKTQKQLLAANTLAQNQLKASENTNFTYTPQHSGLTLTLPKSYGVLVECDGNCGGAEGLNFKVVPASTTNIATDWGSYDEAQFEAQPIFTSLTQLVTAAEQETMDNAHCNSQNGTCDISDLSVSDTTVAGIPAKLIKANGINEYLGNENVYVVGLGKWEYIITVNNRPNDTVTNELVTTLINGISIKQTMN
jgi:hypothetical protein